MSDNEEREQTAGAVSRRDFLRRAGKEAAETGARFVPGAQLARAALGDSHTGRPGWWQRVLHWRQERTVAEDAEITTATAEEGGDA